MSLEKTKEYFKKYNLEDRVIEFEESSATVELAANIIGCDPKRIAKTLSFMEEEQPRLIVAAGDAKVDNAKYRKKFGIRPRMIKADKVLELTGYEVGGVCPFNAKEGVEVYLDESLKRFETVYPSCGSSNSAIKLTIEELEKHSNYLSWIDVCKGWE